MLKKKWIRDLILLTNFGGCKPAGELFNMREKTGSTTQSSMISFPKFQK